MDGPSLLVEIRKTSPRSLLRPGIGPKLPMEPPQNIMLSHGLIKDDLTISKAATTVKHPIRRLNSMSGMDGGTTRLRTLSQSTEGVPPKPILYGVDTGALPAVQNAPTRTRKLSYSSEPKSPGTREMSVVPTSQRDLGHLKVDTKPTISSMVTPASGTSQSQPAAVAPQDASLASRVTHTKTVVLMAPDGTPISVMCQAPSHSAPALQAHPSGQTILKTSTPQSLLKSPPRSLLKIPNPMPQSCHQQSFAEKSLPYRKAAIEW